jgi:superfamily II DNA/RNA helicase
MASSALEVAPSARLKKPLAPGTRVTIRGEEWIVRSCTRDEELQAYDVTCEGIRGMTKGITTRFLDAFDAIDVINPLDIKFVQDLSAKFRDSKLWIDLWARKIVPSDNSLVIGHKAVVNDEEYQRVPAAMALDIYKCPRPRILIADAVGLGKTIEVGILLAELIKRGRARRILVVVLKSMMTQFQKELWSRFAIALEALDREKIENISRNIPRSMNPLDQIDRAIVSIDTLKTKQCGGMLENAKWDVIVIDECHNVARRGTSMGSQRSQLARRLARASNALILTSATPHDGTQESYASLLELLDPLLVVDPNKTTKADLEPVTIQRYAKDVLKDKHNPRKEESHHVALTPGSSEILKALSEKVFAVLDSKATKTKDILFRTTLSKALMSSPEAFTSVIEERVKKLKKDVDNSRPGAAQDLDFLEGLLKLISKEDITKTPKFRHLCELIESNIPKNRRIVVFTEHRKTQEHLAKALSKKFNLKYNDDGQAFDHKSQVVIFHGGQSENLQQQILEDFQAESSKVKFLIATDVASEGVNLHYHCSHMIHFDLPWSLITICQRNGRIDRYGQGQTPYIHYLIASSDDVVATKLCERRVAEILIAKARRAETTMGDVGIMLGQYEPAKEEIKIATAIQNNDTLDDAFFREIVPEISQTIYPNIAPKISPIWRPITDGDFATHGLSLIKTGKVDKKTDIELSLSDESPGGRTIAHAMRAVEKELGLKKSQTVTASSNPDQIRDAIKAARRKSGQWPETSYWWELHPAFEALSQLVEGQFPKDEALVLGFESSAGKGFLGFLVYDALYDDSGNPVISRLRFAKPEKNDDWTFLDPSVALQTIGWTDKTANAGAELSSSEIKSLRSHSKSLFEVIKSRTVVEMGGKQGQRQNLVDVERIRREKWGKNRSQYLKDRFGSALHKRRLEQELNILETLWRNHQEYVDRLDKVRLSNIYMRVVAAFWGQ